MYGCVQRAALRPATQWSPWFSRQSPIKSRTLQIVRHQFAVIPLVSASCRRENRPRQIRIYITMNICWYLNLKMSSYTSMFAVRWSGVRRSNSKYLIINACSTDCRPLVPFRDDLRPYGSSSLGEENAIFVRVHSPRGGAAAEPNTVFRNSYNVGKIIDVIRASNMIQWSLINAYRFYRDEQASRARVRFSVCC